MRRRFKGILCIVDSVSNPRLLSTWHNERTRQSIMSQSALQPQLQLQPTGSLPWARCLVEILLSAEPLAVNAVV